jgi:signal transduction histidine kinase
LFRSTPKPIAIWSLEDSQLIAVTDAWVRATGYRREDAVGVTAVQLGLLRGAEDLQRLHRALESHPKSAYSARGVRFGFRMKNGVLRTGAVSVERFESGGQTVAVAVMSVLLPLRRARRDAVLAHRVATQAREEERLRIGRELHDDIAQRLALLQISIDQLKTFAPRPDNLGLTGEIDSLSKATGEIAAAVRSVVYDLHPPPSLMPARLDQALGELCATVGTLLNLEVSFLSKRVSAVSPAVARAALRVLQEALSNVAKHSGSKDVTVRLWQVLDNVFLSVRDKGRGFEIGSGSRGIGLETMRERVESLDGGFWIASRPSIAGTWIAARFPIHPVKPHGSVASRGAASGRES